MLSISHKKTTTLTKNPMYSVLFFFRKVAGHSKVSLLSPFNSSLASSVTNSHHTLYVKQVQQNLST